MPATPLTLETTPPVPPKRRPRLKTSGFIAETIRTLLFVVAVTVLFDMAIPRSLVDGRSMQPTFLDGERLIVSRVHYLIAKPHRGEIVVFNTVNPNEPPETMLIKRVIGLPGELVELRDGQIYIDGTLLPEPYLPEPCRSYSCTDGRWELADDEYFVMGDNRNQSQDSRRFGPVPYSHIVGEVVFRYWSPERIGLIQGHDYLTEPLP